MNLKRSTLYILIILLALGHFLNAHAVNIKKITMRDIDFNVSSLDLEEGEIAGKIELLSSRKFKRSPLAYIDFNNLAQNYPSDRFVISKVAFIVNNGLGSGRYTLDYITTPQNITRITANNEAFRTSIHNEVMLSKKVNTFFSSRRVKGLAHFKSIDMHTDAGQLSAKEKFFIQNTDPELKTPDRFIVINFKDANTLTHGGLSINRYWDLEDGRILVVLMQVSALDIPAPRFLIRKKVIKQGWSDLVYLVKGMYSESGD
ncbi:MAG: hypothetical protein ISR65_06805 [Bacteriovoracaceae bacterium]|nr:hypothetical protein [Bacteriovoracaceae bacterium]